MALKHLLAGTALIGLMAQPALAQSQDTTQQPPVQAGQQRPAQAVQHELAQEDLEFATKAAQGGIKEVRLGELAQQQAATPEVQQFGQRMVQDHGQANDQLMQIAESKGIELPKAMPQEAQQLHDELQQKSGAEFDQVYMDDMVNDHEKDVEAFQQYVETGQDPDLKSFAEQTLPVLEQHLQLAQQTQERVTAAAGQGEQPDAAAQQQESMQQQPTTQPEQAMSIDQVLGSKVVNANGDEVGEIEDLVLDQNQTHYAVLSVGGFLGIGDKKVAIPLEDLQLGEDEVYLMTSATEEQLEQMPEYDEEQFQPYAQR
jgi:putative membrane protein